MGGSYVEVFDKIKKYNGTFGPYFFVQNIISFQFLAAVHDFLDDLSHFKYKIFKIFGASRQFPYIFNNDDICKNFREKNLNRTNSTYGMVWYEAVMVR